MQAHALRRAEHPPQIRRGLLRGRGALSHKRNLPIPVLSILRPHELPVEKRQPLQRLLIRVLLLSNSRLFQRHQTVHRRVLRGDTAHRAAHGRCHLRLVHHLQQQQKRRCLADAPAAQRRQLHRDGHVQPDGRVPAGDTRVLRQGRERQ